MSVITNKGKSIEGNRLQQFRQFSDERKWMRKPTNFFIGKEEGGGKGFSKVSEGTRENYRESYKQYKGGGVRSC